MNHVTNPSRHVLLATLVSALAAVGCGDDDVRLGTINFYGSQDLSAPAEVAVGEAFPVRVITFGGGCIGKDHTETTVSGLEAEIFPFDLDTTSHKTVCTSDLRFLDHSVTLEFAEEGTATVNIHGIRTNEVVREITDIWKFKVRVVAADAN